MCHTAVTPDEGDAVAIGDATGTGVALGATVGAGVEEGDVLGFGVLLGAVVGATVGLGLGEGAPACPKCLPLLSVVTAWLGSGLPAPEPPQPAATSAALAAKGKRAMGNTRLESRKMEPPRVC